MEIQIFHSLDISFSHITSFATGRPRAPARSRSPQWPLGPCSGQWRRQIIRPNFTWPSQRPICIWPAYRERARSISISTRVHLDIRGQLRMWSVEAAAVNQMSRSVATFIASIILRCMSIVFLRRASLGQYAKFISTKLSGCTGAQRKRCRPFVFEPLLLPFLSPVAGRRAGEESSQISTVTSRSNGAPLAPGQTSGGHGSGAKIYVHNTRLPVNECHMVASVSLCWPLCWAPGW